MPPLDAPPEALAEAWQPPQARGVWQARARSSSPSVVTGDAESAAVNSHHMRAARALLGWAMSDLAEVSGLSLSTIRRLEQNLPAVSPRNRQCAVNALRTGGIRFLALDDGTLALSILRAADSDAITGTGAEPAPALSGFGRALPAHPMPPTAFGANDGTGA